jgi:hypothetical protein
MIPLYLLNKTITKCKQKEKACTILQFNTPRDSERTRKANTQKKNIRETLKKQKKGKANGQKNHTEVLQFHTPRKS